MYNTVTEKDIIDCYNKSAHKYAETYYNELQYKHLDRILLSAFYAENNHKGLMLDLGCGPGQTTAFMHNLGKSDIIGIDISDGIIAKAKELNPQIEFRQGNILNLDYENDSIGSMIGFYSIVHFTLEHIRSAFREIHRVLQNEGEFLFSFHIGSETVHRNTFLEQEVNINFYFFQIEDILPIVLQEHFTVIDSLIREPYSEHEYPSKRAYVWVRKK